MKPPLPNSYWVEPGRLLAGEFPGGEDAEATRERLATLVAAGVRSFVDLTEPHELTPYRTLLPEGVQYANFPMPDHSLPRAPQQMRDVQHALSEGMQQGVVYVHCRAGIGRTGMAVGCYLRERGESAQGALTVLNELWQQNARAARWPSIPETDEQENYIRDWRARSQAEGPRQRYRGCLLGLAVGDGLANAAEDDEGGLAWTDDTGMTLCVAESLLASDGFDGRDQLERYRVWSRDPQAAGAAASSALRPVVRDVLTRSLLNRSVLQGSHDPAHVDPSPLARCAAAALFAGGRVALASALAADTARVTHQAPVLVDACRLYAGMLAQALAGRSREMVLASAGQLGGMPLRDEVRAVAAGWLAPPGGRRKPYQAALGVLDRATRCFARSRGFADGMRRALASPGNDRDAICAVYGALAGAFHGEDAIDAHLLGRVAGIAQLETLAERLHEHGSVAHGVA